MLPGQPVQGRVIVNGVIQNANAVQAMHVVQPAHAAPSAGDAAVLGVRRDAPDPPPVLRAVRTRDAASFQLPDGERCRCEQRPRLPVAAGAAGAGGGLKRLWSAGGRRSESFGAAS